MTVTCFSVLCSRLCPECCREPLWTQKVTQNDEKTPTKYQKIIEKSTEKSITECLKNAGRLCQKSSINSEDTRWATPSAGQAFLGCGGLALASSIRPPSGPGRVRSHSPYHGHTMAIPQKGPRQADARPPNPPRSPQKTS